MCRWSEDAESAGDTEWGKVTEKFSILVKVELEQGNPTLETFNKIGRPFGYKVGFVRKDDKP